jgi:sec-independent protein translocase protein TatA
MPGGWEWLIIIGVLLLLFGAKRLPDMARSVGQSARVFKGEMKGLKDDDGRNATSPGSTARAGDRPATSSAAPADRAPVPPVDGQVNGAPGQPSGEPVRPDTER